MTVSQFGLDLSYIPHGRDLGYDLSRTVVEGMWPFKVERVELEYDYNIDLDHYRLFVTAVGGDWWARYKMFVDPVELVEGPETHLLKLCRQLLKLLRQRAADPVPDNVVLGEN